MSCPWLSFSSKPRVFIKAFRNILKSCTLDSSIIVRFLSCKYWRVIATNASSTALRARASGSLVTLLIWSVVEDIPDEYFLAAAVPTCELCSVNRLDCGLFSGDTVQPTQTMTAASAVAKRWTERCRKTAAIRAAQNAGWGGAKRLYSYKPREKGLKKLPSSLATL